MCNYLVTKGRGRLGPGAVACSSKGLCQQLLSCLQCLTHVLFPEDQQPWVSGAAQLLQMSKQTQHSAMGAECPAHDQFCDGTLRVLSPCEQREVESTSPVLVPSNESSALGILLNQVSSQPCLTNAGLPMGAELIAALGASPQWLHAVWD